MKKMIFAPGLIQPCGLGIHCAKHAMAENGNPPLYFEPANVIDDYTMVTCPINEELAYIRDHEDEATNLDSRRTVPSAQETADDAQESIPNEGETTPRETTKELANTTKEPTEEQAQGATGATNSSREKIVMLLSESPRLATEQPGKRLGISPDGVRHHLKAPRKDGVTRHEGPTNAGFGSCSKRRTAMPRGKKTYNARNKGWRGGP